MANDNSVNSGYEGHLYFFYIICCTFYIFKTYNIYIIYYTYI